MPYQRRLRSAAGGNAHRGAQVPVRRDRRSGGSFADAAGLCPGVLPKICGAGFAVAGDNLFWLEPAQSVDRLAAGHGDRTAAGQLERTDGAAGAVRHRENDYRVSRVVDRRLLLAEPEPWFTLRLAIAAAVNAVVAVVLFTLLDRLRRS